MRGGVWRKDRAEGGRVQGLGGEGGAQLGQGTVAAALPRAEAWKGREEGLGDWHAGPS